MYFECTLKMCTVLYIMFVLVMDIAQTCNKLVFFLVFVETDYLCNNLSWKVYRFIHVVESVV